MSVRMTAITASFTPRIRLREVVGATPVLCLILATLLASGCSDSITGPPAGPNPPSGAGEYDHARGVGASAADLLSGQDFDNLLVQLHYVEGFRPSDAGVQELRDFLAARLNKPGGIEIRIEPALQIASQATYTTAEVRALEVEHRTAYTEGRTLAVHFLFLGGEFAGAANVLGIAYNNTSMAVFQEKVQQNSGGAFQPARATVESVVSIHEFGHILGLVNNGSDMQTEHQDEPNGSHCDDPDCLMYYAVRTTDFMSNLLGGAPSLDQNCLDDLQANGGR